MIARFVLPFRPKFVAISPQIVCRFAFSSFSSSSTKPAPLKPTKVKNPEIKHYPIPSRLPYIDGYLKDYRTDRLILSTIDYKDRSGEERKLQIELLDEFDIALVGQLFADHFMKDCSMVTALSKCFYY